jgi:phosphoribosylformylglycinamidine synthase
MVGVLDDIDCRVTSCFKQEGDVVVLIGSTKDEIGASEYLKVVHGLDTGEVPQLDLLREKALQELLQQAAAEKLLASAHDCAEGGLAVALAECCIDGGLGARIDLASEVRVPSLLFGETQSRVIVSLGEDGVNRLVDLATQKGLPCTIMGRVGGESLTIACYCKELVNLTVDEISKAWREAIPCMME